MTCVPSFEDFERCAVAHFADDNAIRAKPERHLHKIAHGDRRIGALCEQLNRIGAATLQFGGVFKDDDTRC